jgi:hypothetical protein
MRVESHLCTPFSIFILLTKLLVYQKNCLLDALCLDWIQVATRTSKPGMGCGWLEISLRDVKLYSM